MTYPQGYVPFQSGFRLIDGTALNRAFGLFGQSISWPGNVYYVNPAVGADGNGGTVNQPVATLTRALTLAKEGNNDVVVLVGNGLTTGTARLSSTLVWNKDATHLVGITAPSLFNQRARIAPPTTATVNINPLIDIQASGCIFDNFSIFQGIGQASTDEQLMTIEGSRNDFSNVAFGGMGHANGAARAGSYIIGLNGGSENTFVGCSIGLETVARSAANASVKLLAAGQRNDFINCVFDMYPTANSPLFLDASLAGALNGGTMMFQRCLFRGLISAAGGTQPSVTATVAAALNGDIYFDFCSTIAAKYAASTEVHVSGAAASGTGGVVTNGV
jgi:hypothetical protein